MLRLFLCSSHISCLCFHLLWFRILSFLCFNRSFLFNSTGLLAFLPAFLLVAMGFSSVEVILEYYPGFLVLSSLQSLIPQDLPRGHNLFLWNLGLWSCFMPCFYFSGSWSPPRHNQDSFQPSHSQSGISHLQVWCPSVHLSSLMLFSSLLNCLCSAMLPLQDIKVVEVCEDQGL